MRDILQTAVGEWVNTSSELPCYLEKETPTETLSYTDSTKMAKHSFKMMTGRMDTVEKVVKCVTKCQ